MSSFRLRVKDFYFRYPSVVFSGSVVSIALVYAALDRSFPGRFRRFPIVPLPDEFPLPRGRLWRVNVAEEEVYAAGSRSMLFRNCEGAGEEEVYASN